MIYCVKERKYTEDINPKQVTTKNNRHMIKATCASCGITKTMFVKPPSRARAKLEPPHGSRGG